MKKCRLRNGTSSFSSHVHSYNYVILVAPPQKGVLKPSVSCLRFFKHPAWLAGNRTDWPMVIDVGVEHEVHISDLSIGIKLGILGWLKNYMYVGLKLLFDKLHHKVFSAGDTILWLQNNY